MPDTTNLRGPYGGTTDVPTANVTEAKNTIPKPTTAPVPPTEPGKSTMEQLNDAITSMGDKIITVMTGQNPPNGDSWYTPTTEGSDKIQLADLGYDRYFTAVQSQIYINQALADELFGVMYTASNGATPFFGYASKYFDAVAMGKTVIEGQLMVYYNKVKYLWVLLKGETEVTEQTLADSIADELKANPQASDDEKMKIIMAGLKKRSESQNPSNPVYVSGDQSEVEQDGGTPTSPGADRMVWQDKSTTPPAPTGGSPLDSKQGSTAGTGAVVKGAQTSTTTTTPAENSNVKSGAAAAIDAAYEAVIPGSTKAPTKEDAKAIEQAANASAENDAATGSYTAIQDMEETDLDIAGPFDIMILTGISKQNQSESAALKTILKDCFILGKSRNYYQDDKIIFTGYTFIARKEIDI